MEYAKLAGSDPAGTVIRRLRAVRREGKFWFRRLGSLCLVSFIGAAEPREGTFFQDHGSRRSDGVGGRFGMHSCDFFVIVVR
jgi:hypothetical protein